MATGTNGPAAKATYHGPGVSCPATQTTVKLRSVEVSKALQDGEKFIKWDEDSGVGTPVTLRVDPKGFYLHWIDQNHETDLLDIATIRDSRTGQYAKIPKDPKLKQIVTMGSQDTLEEKTVTICYGSDFVNLNFINFCCTRKDIAKVWTDELLQLAYNLTQLNGSATMFLQKAYTKILLMVDKTGKIPVKNVVKMFAQNKEDRRRVEKALDLSGFPSGKGDLISEQKFTFEEFYNFYKNLTQRNEVEKIFEELVGNSKRRLMSTQQLVDFLNKTQRDPRLNEILHPYANPARAKDLISQYEPNKFNSQKGQLSFDGFLRYLMSEENPIMAVSKLELCADMQQPLAHYFINSSHNTYLTGHQLTGKSSVEIYRQCLLAGCRCVELDFWNGRFDEPVVCHGYTFVTDISAREVLEAIAESSFKTSDYPVILSFENHCNPRQQAKIANYCRDIFGDMLLDKPLDSHPLEPSYELPPPHFLMRKIIIKNKKKHHHHHHHHHKKVSEQQQPEAKEDVTTGNGDVPHHAPPLQQVRQSSKDSTGSSDSDSSSGEEDGPIAPVLAPGAATNPDNKVPQARETEAGAEISALVNYVQPVHFNSFENSEKKNRFYEMSSFDEKQATTLLKERPIEFVNYNKHQLSRVYPAGTRFDSSNFMPQVFWNAGCQLVALNYQTLDLAMQLNLGIFEYNNRCGFILKPEFMRRKDRRLDPFAESTVDGIIAGTVSINVISAQFLTDKRVGTYVEVDMYGLPADTFRKKFRTKIVPNNGINPVYGDEPFVFKKVVLPELASIRLAAYEEGGRLIGHRVLPVVGLCPGYRHVTLRTEIGQPIPLSTLFLHIVVKDYVPHSFLDFAEALANPIKYQSDLEKRSQQLAILTEGMEPMNEEDVPVNMGSKKELRPNDTIFGSPKHRASICASSALGVSITENNDSDHEISEAVAAPMLSQASIDQPIVSKSEIVTIVSEEIRAESLEKILENKLVKEKKVEFEKKIESLKKKHDKEKCRIQTQRSTDFTDSVKRSKFYMGNKLVKRLSSKNMDTPLQISSNNSELGECSETDGEKHEKGISRSQSERLLAVCKEQANQLRELKEKYHDIIYSTAEKVMRASQANQMKNLRALLDRETADVMRGLQTTRRKEVKDLVKERRDRDELLRMKREVASSIVERGVTERVRLAQDYEKRRDELQRDHDNVKEALSSYKAKEKAALIKEFESRGIDAEPTASNSTSTLQLEL